MPGAGQTTPLLVKVSVELFGNARVISGRSAADITVPASSHDRDIVTALADACPELVGAVVQADLSGLQSSYVFNVNGEKFVADGQLDLSPGDSILLFSSQAGG